MRSAEGGEKIVKRHLVGHVDDCEARAPSAPISVKQIVITDRNVEQIPRLDALGIVIVILLSGRWHLQVNGTET
jgi:hypothetical protein